jgi:mersacidin/lichenicidin family type 2 lantibiotic
MPKRSNATHASADEVFRSGVSADDQTLLAGHPAGLIELFDVDLDGVIGGLPSATPHTGCCPHCQVCDGGTP